MQESRVETDKAVGELQQVNTALTQLVLQILNEQQRIEEGLIKANRLESVAVMAGGIAHDFNNILTTILGNISLAKRLAHEDSKLITRLDNAEKAALRARHLTRQLLTMTKEEQPRIQLASMREVLQEAVDFSLRGSNVRHELSLPQGLWPVKVDAGQISQVVHNLIINAEHAMPDGGVIRIDARNCHLDDTAVTDLPMLRPGTYVHIAIEDDGCGIEAGHLQRIFDPYFTTKANGNGLGLATAYTIMHKHHGAIYAESEVGAGTTFHLYLPASSTQQTRSRTGGKPSMARGSGRILMLEDDATLHEAIGNGLELMGYEVMLTQDGCDTLAAYQRAHEAGEPFAAVVLNLTVPGGTGGHQTMIELLTIDPQVKAIVTSGYATDPLLLHFRDYGFCGALAKPYRVHQLHRILCDVIEPPAPSAILSDHCPSL